MTDDLIDDLRMVAQECRTEGFNWRYGVVTRAAAKLAAARAEIAAELQAPVMGDTWRDLYDGCVAACLWMHADKSLGLKLGESITTDGVRRLHEQRDQLRADLAEARAEAASQKHSRDAIAAWYSTALNDADELKSVLTAARADVAHLSDVIYQLNLDSLDEQAWVHRTKKALAAAQAELADLRAQLDDVDQERARQAHRATRLAAIVKGAE